MLDNHAAFHPEKVIEGMRLAAPFAFAHGENKIALAKHGVDLGVLKHVVLRGQRLDRLDDPAQPVGNRGVVLGVAFRADVLGDVAGVLAHQHILDQRYG